jgi:hypothetical protein
MESKKIKSVEDFQVYQKAVNLAPFGRTPIPNCSRGLQTSTHHEIKPNLNIHITIFARYPMAESRLCKRRGNLKVAATCC